MKPHLAGYTAAGGEFLSASYRLYVTLLSKL